MITTRRQITNEQDRYGGYASRPTSEITREDTEELRPDDFTRYPRRRNTVDTGVDFDTETAYKHEEELRYSERPLKPGLEEYIGLPKVKAPTRASVKSQKKRMPRESEDIMPSIKTRAYMTDRPVEEIEEQTEKKTIINKTVKKGLSFGSALAMVISYTTWRSVGWAIFHGLLSWVYVIYFMLRY